MPRAGGVSSTPQSIVSITNVSGILDHPLEPVIGVAEGETRWRVMTTECAIAISRHQSVRVLQLLTAQKRSRAQGNAGCPLHP
jgi:hypothetical protein